MSRLQHCFISIWKMLSVPTPQMARIVPNADFGEPTMRGMFQR